VSWPRDVARWLWAVLLMFTGSIYVARRKLRQQHAIVVLALHRVLDDDDWLHTHSLPGMVMRRRTFERLAAFVTRRFDVVSLQTLTPGDDPGRQRIAFTFDDGWIDTYALLTTTRRLNIPITVFVCPGLVGRIAPFWPEQFAELAKDAFPSLQHDNMEDVINRLKLCPEDIRQKAIAVLGTLAGRDLECDTPDLTMSWNQIKELNASGAAIGSHTNTHQILTTVPENVARDEILISKDHLELMLARACCEFAYPNGNHSASLRKILAEAGTEHAFTTDLGAWLPDSDPLAIPRVNLAEAEVTGPAGRFSAAMFEYTAFWKVYRASCKG
jgi:peptidoglycan/xylan/chitin deacetylase (PgdA/CDA1 family)